MRDARGRGTRADDGFTKASGQARRSRNGVRRSDANSLPKRSTQPIVGSVFVWHKGHNASGRDGKKVHFYRATRLAGKRSRCAEKVSRLLPAAMPRTPWLGARASVKITPGRDRCQVVKQNARHWMLGSDVGVCQRPGQGTQQLRDVFGSFGLISAPSRPPQRGASSPINMTFGPSLGEMKVTSTEASSIPSSENGWLALRNSNCPDCNS